MGLHVVVCDDEAHIVRAIEMKLSKAGIPVKTARDGESGWKLISKHPPGAVVTDWQMPRLSGLELIKRIRSNETTKSVPVILLTAKGFELDEQELIKQFNVTKVLVKPFSPRELLKHVLQLLRNKSLYAGAVTPRPCELSSLTTFS